MKLLLLLFTALSVGCALVMQDSPPAAPLALTAEPQPGLFAITATLADANNPAEMAASVVYTKLALTRKLAAAKLRHRQENIARGVPFANLRGGIDADEARALQSWADAARARLDAAVARKDLHTIQMVGAAVATDYQHLEAK
jgi:hypothetical protein